MLTFRGSRASACACWVLAAALSGGAALAAVPTPVPAPERGKISYERRGLHDASNIRTLFYNFGMVGDYGGDADLTLFHSMEVPKGSGMNYSDGVTPFVLAKINDRYGTTKYLMETGYRERQEESPLTARQMRFEPRPGYFNPDPHTNLANTPAISTDPRSWPGFWPDKLDDVTDPGWAGSWNGYFGKHLAADQESYTVMDDQAYIAIPYTPDSRDSSRAGLGLRVEVRGFQWANPQAGNVIFWHYDITNESTAVYDSIIFGLYMDTGVGGSRWSCDQRYESDDDNAFWDRGAGLNLVYTWDNYGHGMDLKGCERTGYLGYAYLETPGNEFDNLDNDQDGIKDESRVNEVAPGELPIAGQDNIRAELAARVDTVKFIAFYGPLSARPAFRAGIWYPEDEDLDWNPEFDDVGVDGVAGTQDTGEGDGKPTQGEPNFGRTDLNESDQIGLTGFKMNRIKSAPDNPSNDTDGIVFWDDGQHWPETLYGKFTKSNPADRFDAALASNYNIGFLFASGPFLLRPGATERFSLALAYGSDLGELRTNVRTVQQIYDANYQFAVPPPAPTLSAEAGDGYVKLSWDDVAERGVDPVTHERDFEGYKIYRSTDPNFLDVKVLTSGQGNPSTLAGKPSAQFDLPDSLRGYFTRRTVEGVGYWLGSDTGIQHTWTDYDVTNGQRYFYAITAYDYGALPSTPEDKVYFPSENSFNVLGKPRGGFVTPRNVVQVRPNPRAPGFTRAAVENIRHTAGRGSGSVRVEISNSDSVLAGHHYALRFSAPNPDSIRATSYALVDTGVPGGRVLFTTGSDFDSAGVGVTAEGLQPIVKTALATRPDTARVRLRAGASTNARFRVIYQPGRLANYRRPGYPDDFRIEFDDAIRDTGLRLAPVPFARPARFRVFAQTEQGDVRLKFRFQDLNANGYLDQTSEYIDVITYKDTPIVPEDATWRVQFDPAFGVPVPRLASGDTLDVPLIRPLSDGDVFEFTTTGQTVNSSLARDGWNQKPYAVPNPYVGAASFEPARLGTSGRGERRIEFRAIPVGSVIRIYTIRGGLVRTLRQDGSTAGYVAWDLRNTDNLDIAPGLYLFHVEAPGIGTYVGKMAVVK